MKIDLLTNKSHIGSLGEFIYEKFAKQQGFKIDKTGILEHDFLIDSKYRIDVKSTKMNKSNFNGRRVSDSISYDLIVFHEDKVFLYPDHNSPLKKFSGVCLGDFRQIFNLWQEWRKNNKSRSKIKSNAIRNSRILIKKKLLDILNFADDVRVIFRGSVSQTRWSSAPDNLPGSISVQKKYCSTFFIQMQTKEEIEIVADIYYFDHKHIDKFPFMSPDLRQSKKGIARIVDLKQYKLKFPHLVFNDLNEVKNHFKNHNSNNPT